MARELTVRIIGDPSSLQRAFGQSAAAADTFGAKMAAAGRSMQAVGATMTRHLTVPILAVAGESVKLALGFETAMQRVRTAAGASQKEVNNMSGQVLGLAKSLKGAGQSPTELANALLYVESAGFRGGKAVEVLSAAAVNATVTGADLVEVEKALSAAMKTHIVGAENATRAMGTLNAIVGAGKMVMGDLTAALSTGILPAAKNVGISLAQVGAAIDVMTLQGIPAQQAATKLTATFLRMESPTKASAKALGALGIGSSDLANALQRGGLTDALGLLVSKYKETEKTAGAVQAKQELMAAFGRSRGGAAVLALVEGWDLYNKSLQHVNSTTGDYTRNSAAAMDTSAMKTKVSLDTIKASLIQLGETLAPVFAQIVDFASHVAEQFDRLSPQTKKMVLFGLGIVAALGPAISIVGRLTSMISLLAANPILLLIGALVAVGGALAAAAFAPKQFQSVLEKLGVSAKTAKTVVDDLGKAAHVIGDVFRSVWPMIRAAVVPVLERIRDLVLALSDVLHGNLGDALHQIGRLFTDTWNGIKSQASALVDMLAKVFTPIGSFFMQNVALPIEHAFQAAWSAVVAGFWTAMHALERAGLDAALAVLEPFSHLPSFAGKWARDLKDKIHVELNSMKLDEIVNAINQTTPKVAEGWKKMAAQASINLHGVPKDVAKMFMPLPGLVGSALAPLPGKVGEAVAAAVAAAAGQIGNAASVGNQIGSALGQGVVSGVTSATAGLAATIGAQVNAALGSVKGLLGIHSPSQVTRDQIGKPLGEGILLGYLDGTANLPTKMSQSLRNAIEHAKQAVDNMRSSFSNAWQQLGSDAMSAFDAATQAGLNKIDAKLQARLAQIANGLQSKLNAIDASLAAKQSSIDRKYSARGANPYRDQLNDMQALDQQAQLQKSLTQAQIQAEKAQDAYNQAVAQYGVDSQQAADALVSMQQAQQGVADAQRAIEENSLQVQADERDKFNQQRADREKAQAQQRADREKTNAQKQADLATAAAQKRADREKLNFQAERDLHRRHLQQWLDDEEKMLEKRPELWQKAHDQLMKKFKNEFGPNFKTAGNNLGNAFAQGLRESFSQVAKFAAELGHIIAQYLMTHSPTEKGALSTLDTWWTGMADTLIGGFDHQRMATFLNGIASPAHASATFGGRGGGFQSATAPITVHIHVDGKIDGRQVWEGMKTHVIRDSRRGLRFDL